MPGTYYVRVVGGGSFAFSPQHSGTDGRRDSDVNESGQTALITLSAGQNRFNIDAGLVPYGSIGNRVWADVNANGIQDNGEAGLAGVSLSLYTDGNYQSGTVTSDAQGNYVFENVTPGNYYIVVMPPMYHGVGPQNQGGDSTLDNNFGPDGAYGRTGTFSLTLGQNRTDIDAGLVPFGSIGNRVWADVNANGIQDNGEAGLAGISLTLYTESNYQSGTVTSDAQGNYVFQNIAPGNYYISIMPPMYYGVGPQNQGSDTTIDNNFGPDGAYGKTGTFSLALGQNRADIDAGLAPYPTIQGNVWDDDGDGIQEAGEGVRGGIMVELFDAQGFFLTSTSTDNNGHYSFGAVPAATYRLAFQKYMNDSFAPQDAGSDDALDSDVNANGITAYFTALLGGQYDLDAGLVSGL